MTIKTTLAAIALALAPTFALAGPGCGGDKEHMTTASSCQDGYTWDEAKATCVMTPSS